MKYRRKPIIVNAIHQPDGSWFIQWPWGDQTMADEHFKREFDEAAPDASVGCCCAFDESRRVLGDNAGISHAATCPLSSF